MTFYIKEMNMERVISFFFRIEVSLKFLHISFQNEAKYEKKSACPDPNYIEVYCMLYRWDPSIYAYIFVLSM